MYDELELWILATWKHLEVVISTCCELHDELAYYTILDNLLNLDVLILYRIGRIRNSHETSSPRSASTLHFVFT